MAVVCQASKDPKMDSITTIESAGSCTPSTKLARA